MTHAAKPKIPWPFKDERSLELEMITNDFWRIAQTWNGRGEHKTVQDALGECQDIMNTTNPQNLVAKRAGEMFADIINYGTKSKKNRALKIKPTITRRRATIL